MHFKQARKYIGCTGLMFLVASPITPVLRAQTLGVPTTPAALKAEYNPNSTTNVSLSQEDLGKYTLGAGDSLKIDIFNVPELSGTQLVAPDGTITIALVGAIPVQGLTIEETARLLEKKLAPFLVRKIVNVTLLAPRPLSIGVVGEVNRPGTRILPPAGGTTTLTRALEIAGGITQQADVSNIQISRLGSGGQRHVIRVDLLSLLRQGDLSQDIKILDRDSIFVPGFTDPTATQPRQVGASSFAPDAFTVQISVTGEVNKKGPQTLSYSRTGTGVTAGVSGAVSNLLPTVTRAIQQAGGITQRADVRNIKIIRTSVGGEKIIINANLWDLIDKGDLSQDIRLIDGDSVVVSIAAKPNTAEFGQIAQAVYSPATITVRILGEAKSPGTITLTPNAPFTEAIAAVGGLTNGADWKNVDLYRINPDGSLTQRKLVADLTLPANETTNPSLRDRDVIVVRESFGSSLLSAAQRLSTVVSPFLFFNSLFK